MAYEIEFDPEAVKDLKKLDRPVQQRIVGRVFTHRQLARGLSLIGRNGRRQLFSWLMKRPLSAPNGNQAGW